MATLVRRAIALAITLALTATPVMAQSATIAPGAIQTLGCYSDPGPGLKEFGDATGQSSGYCRDNCTNLAQPVMAITGGVTCYCGNELPALDTQVDPDNCNVKCMGYGLEDCGGMGFYQLYLTGLGANVHTAPNSTSSASSGSGSTSTSAPAPTKPNETVFVTPTGSSDSVQKSSNDGVNKVGIAVGVVVGVLALAAIIGVVVFIMKRKRNRDIEEEHRRNAANSFLSGKSDKSATDQRLDPSIYSHQRQSIGSIADERDFSRRILQVCQPTNSRFDVSPNVLLQVRNPDRDSVRSGMGA